MTIRNVEPRLNLGILAIGTKLGNPVEDRGHLTDILRPHGKGWLDLELVHLVSMFTDGESIKIVGNENPFCAACKPLILERSEINGDPIVSQRYRWTES